MSVDTRNEAFLHEYCVENAETTDFPGNYADFDDSWDLQSFKENVEENAIEFDMIGISPAIANAFRRILLAEVPTMAIEKVFIYNNTSILQDDFLAHRLGLIPINVDPRYFEYRQEGDEEGTPQDTIVFELKLKCTKNPNPEPDACTPESLYNNRNIYSKHLKWVPIGNQEEIFQGKPIKPVDDDILIAKLSPGQELDLKLHCVKGVGRDHIKFSPVATAFYRLLPKIQLLRTFENDEAEKLKKCFTKGVIKCENVDGKKIAKVVNPRKDTCGRNVFRHPEFKDSVKLSVVKDHFIFSIESTGALSPQTLFLEAVEIFAGKCRHFLGELEEINKDAK
ncbi:DNA-directed RNA polymerases I and III subunit RPAC1-like protein [Dinothrombium tinctorium]|uniref:DNA-directed RNA polymerases I and III subunit RPAC1 n=1 Tax=Dinothrombium tinctorium TaxID=1965070 RepID=A0A3S3SN27_9ACAR|nr:DNA-directed RNA polymerases I and III subunit RPAC1-like protein [Dinothrombium tinctorium]